MKSSEGPADLALFGEQIAGESLHELWVFSWRFATSVVFYTKTSVPT